MAAQNTTPNHDSRIQIMHENWRVMKPFVHFAFKAMAVIGGALIGIIKLLPMLAGHRDDRAKRDRIIKI